MWIFSRFSSSSSHFEKFWSIVDLLKLISRKFWMVKILQIFTVNSFIYSKSSLSLYPHHCLCITQNVIRVGSFLQKNIRGIVTKIHLDQRLLKYLWPRHFVTFVYISLSISSNRYLKNIFQESSSSFMTTTSNLKRILIQSDHNELYFLK